MDRKMAPYRAKFKMGRPFNQQARVCNIIPHSKSLLYFASKVKNVRYRINFAPKVKSDSLILYKYENYLKLPMEHISMRNKSIELMNFTLS